MKSQAIALLEVSVPQSISARCKWKIIIDLPLLESSHKPMQVLPSEKANSPNISSLKPWCMFKIRVNLTISRIVSTICKGQGWGQELPKWEDLSIILGNNRELEIWHKHLEILIKLNPIELNQHILHLLFSHNSNKMKQPPQASKFFNPTTIVC